ncbi:hypothetical protein QF022_002329 [Vogesella perlucida]|nr:hypothetical protein [Vogesella perlucida]
MKLPHLVIYTDRLPEGVGGTANGPLVRIRPEYRDDAGIHAHEYQHVIQWYQEGALGMLLVALIALAAGCHWSLALAIAPVGMAAHSLGYALSASHRLWCEVQAYQVQMQYGLRLDDAALRLMSPRYKLGLRYIDALRLLSA